MTSCYTRCEQLSPRTYLVVEQDRFGQFPFMYVIMGDDKCIVIDSGCGTGDYRAFIAANINKKNLPYLVVNTHVHFDHIGGNHRFCGAHQEGCIDVCMGCGNKSFSQNYAINSLSMAHSYQVKPFEVSRWLNEGDLIYLNDAQPSREQSLEVVFFPGHTPDSIGLYAHWEKRLFVGDIIYPFTTIHVDGIGSNVADYLISLQKMETFIKKQESNPATPETTPSISEKNPSSSSSSSVSSPSPSSDSPTTVSSTSNSTPALDELQKEKIQEFLSILGLDSAAQRSFSTESLMNLCDWDVTSAIDFYLGNSSEISAMCPPLLSSPISSSSQSSQQSQPAHITQNTFSGGNKIVLSCGHVEGNLESSAVSEVIQFLEFVKSGFVEPTSVDGEYGEFSNGNFSLMLPLKPKWNLYTKPQ